MELTLNVIERSSDSQIIRRSGDYVGVVIERSDRNPILKGLGVNQFGVKIRFNPYSGQSSTVAVYPES